MAAQYNVEFSDGGGVYVYSADSRTMKRADLTAALVKARKKGEAKYAKQHPGGKLPTGVKPTRVRCVG